MGETRRTRSGIYGIEEELCCCRIHWLRVTLLMSGLRLCNSSMEPLAKSSLHRIVVTLLLNYGFQRLSARTTGLVWSGRIPAGMLGGSSADYVYYIIL